MAFNKYLGNQTATTVETITLACNWWDVSGSQQPLEFETIDIPASQILREHIISNLSEGKEIDNLSDWQVYLSLLPEGKGIKDNSIAVYDTEGIQNGRYMRTGNYVEKYGCQIKVRSSDYESGFSKITNIYNKIEYTSTPFIIEINSKYYKINNISFTSPILSLGQETSSIGGKSTKRRFLFSLNVLMSVDKITDL